MHENNDNSFREIRVSFIDDQNKLIDGFAWQMLADDNATETSKYISAVLDQTGIGGAIVAKGTLPVTYNSEGDPEFFVPPPVDNVPAPDCE